MIVFNYTRAYAMNYTLVNNKIRMFKWSGERIEIKMLSVL